MSVLGSPLPKLVLSYKFGVAVFKASILNSLGGPLAKVGSSATFGVAVYIDLPRSALTIILHITTGKYEPS